jgi:outer membrane protein assembly factor BamD
MTFRPRQSPLIAASLLVLGAGACASRQAEDLAYIERPVEQLYLTGTDALERNRYLEAIQHFNEVERQHPYSEWAQRAQVMSAYTSYKQRDYEAAIAGARRYLDFNPASDSAPYAYYIIAISHFDQIVDVGRDQGTTESAKAALTDVVRRFPETDYARDAQLKLDMVNDQLAGKEMTVGRWYLREGQHVAALNRFRTVVADYATTSHSPEALYRLVEGYLTLGLTEEAKSAAAVLGHNHADTQWYADAYTLLAGQGVQVDEAPETRRKRFLGIF